MKCRQCGIEIADKALVCYKCGTAATEAKFKAPPAARKPRPSASLLINILAVVLLALCALYMARVATVGAPDGLRWVILVLAIVVVAFRLRARRGRR
jgi:hypothetical protein